MTFRYNDMEIRPMVVNVTEDGQRVCEYAVISNELDLGPKALENIRELANTDATPYSKFKKLLCVQIVLPRGQTSPTDQDLQLVAEAIRRAQPNKQPPKKGRWRR